MTLADPALDYAIREYLKKPSGGLTEKDIAGFRVIWIFPDSIRLNGSQTVPLPSDLLVQSLKDLPSFPNLGFLLLDQGSYDDYSPIGDCPKLQKLGLSRLDTLEDLTFLTRLERLVVLSIHTNPLLTDFSVLAELTALQELDLHNAGLLEFPPIAGLTDLRKLILHNNRIEDISGLEALTKLTGLDLHTNRITDISVLAHLPKLEILRLENNKITEVTALSSMPELRSLALSYNDVQSLLPLYYLPRLRKLELKRNPAIDATQIAELRLALPEDCVIEWS